MYYTYFNTKRTINFITLNVSEKDLCSKATIKIKNPFPKTLLNLNQKKHIKDTVEAFKECWLHLYLYKDTHDQEYYKFFIPKRNHKLREINAPNESFKKSLAAVKDIFQNKIKCLPHNAAHAYIPGTDTTQALQKHQKNKSQWFLKIDLKDFFPSCTLEVVYKYICELFPFYYLNEKEKETLKAILKITTLNNSMPQGSPFSPYITNLVMVHFDYCILDLLKKQKNNKFVYTRYADDMLISAKKEFDWKALQEQIQKILEPAFQINKLKTRYGSRAGSNWNLGLMLNKDNNITLGHIKKKTLNAMLNNFFTAYKEGTPWEVHDTQILQGQLSYLAHIEPDYYSYIIQKYEKKFGKNYHDILSEILNPIKV